MRKMALAMVVTVGVILMAAAAFGQTNLTVVRHSDNTLWKMTCKGTSDCSAWTQIQGKFSVQPTLTWDSSIQKYILIGIGNNKTSIYRGTFEADGTWNNDWTLITGTSPSPVAVAGGYAGAKRNPMKIALLKWYEANQVTSFAVGDRPLGVAFDGANIWVANYNSFNVTKLNAATGATVGTYAVGGGPAGVAFDGANIWVTNFNSNNVTKLRASDGSLVGTYSVGSGPGAIAFDGANIWVTNVDDDNVMKLNAATGAVVGSYTVGDAPLGVAFDGANIWVANYRGDTVTKLNAATGTVVGTYAAGNGPYGIAFDGANIWVTDFNSFNVTKL